MLILIHCRSQNYTIRQNDVKKLIAWKLELSCEKINEGKNYQVTNRTKFSEIKFTKISEYKNVVKELETTLMIDKENQEDNRYRYQEDTDTSSN